MTTAEYWELRAILATLANYLGPEGLDDPLRVLVYRAQSLLERSNGRAAGDSGQTPSSETLHAKLAP